MKCNLCPRKCNVDREDKKIGYCGMTAQLKVARAALHYWEEPCISGEAGSGAVFFSGCQLRCIYCQNRDIAIGKSGKAITIERLAEIFMELQEKKANNINLVTPTHYVPQIIQAIDLARKAGLILPIVYNTSAYETVETLELLEGYVDIYLPDFKYMEAQLADDYSNAKDYFEVAVKAISEMYRQVGNPQFNEKSSKEILDNPIIEEGIMTKGVIVRHLMLPGEFVDSKNIITYLYQTYGNNVFISIMNQYTPLKQVENIEKLNRRITEKEYDKLVDFAIDLGVENGFIQEGKTAQESFIPEFDCEGV
ncbi:radical SAM protein [[Clostridium] fimetarium]|uniref:Putative pyruvate formate lyase activating enzyme n=1 Tax=[Clostridium] fimetarium TaxID=99656 RepID=A0A1I0RAU9_9FIRM|nr:radical SAM protein [[Clostridium] fimetarium]SEW37923.1 putative pyruvate formate lyase activating enzyme [[Clostridium] fimetarium]